MERTASGIPGLDEIIQGGFLQGSAVLVAGGMGIAALVAIAQSMKGRGVVALIGASTKEKVVSEKDLLAMGVDARISTDDGTAGYAGNVCELLEQVLREKGFPRTGCRIFACGPVPMLKEVARIAAGQNIPAYVSLEERMACGVGACLGCACEVVSPEGKTQYKMVCKDGPVFDAREIVWK